MQLYKDNNRSELSIKEIWDRKNILILGANGFIAKAFIALLIEYIPNIEKIYLLLRNKNEKTAQDRFQNIYAESAIFKNIHQKYGKEVKNITNICVVNGDITHKNFNMEDKDYTQLLTKIDLVINFIGDVRFSGPLDEMLNTNTCALLNVINFVIESKKSKLMHISTCYVAGMYVVQVKNFLLIHKQKILIESVQFKNSC